jgi:hypothetical protein
MSVDLIPPDTIVIKEYTMENTEKITDQNITLIVRQYYTPTVEETSKGLVVRFSPNGHSGPEALVWFENAKRGFFRKPLSTNRWMMVDCDLRPIHDLLHKFFHLSEGDFNVTRLTLSNLAHESLMEAMGKKG